MDLAKTRISAAEAGVTSHDAQLAACQQHLNKLCAEAQAADQAAQRVCNVAVTMHSLTLYLVSHSDHCMVHLCCLMCHSSIDAKQTATLATSKLQSFVTCKALAHAGMLGSDTARNAKDACDGWLVLCIGHVLCTYAQGAARVLLCSSIALHTIILSDIVQHTAYW